ncbi:MAG TPA: HD domain-containing protein [Bacteroidales bacterium]|nr:HD domain-containing protein [Bacteroidales bacterium]
MKIIIDKKIVHDLRTWFTSYVKTFKYDNDELQRNIDIKREHTERVTEEIINIGKQLGFNDDELNLAEIIALFHDIGRFEQYDRYKTFSDHKSEDHAELGIKILTKYNVLDILDEEIQILILCSIRYHNQASLPDKETKTCLFYSRLIRDADKLDIWRVVTGYYHRKNGRRNVALELELPDTPGISKEVYKALMNRQSVEMKHVKNINDIKLLQAGWVYDINFKPTLDFIKERRYLEMIREALPESPEIDEIFGPIYRSL